MRDCWWYLQSKLRRTFFKNLIYDYNRFGLHVDHKGREARTRQNIQKLKSTWWLAHNYIWYVTPGNRLGSAKSTVSLDKNTCPLGFIIIMIILKFPIIPILTGRTKYHCKECYVRCPKVEEIKKLTFKKGAMRFHENVESLYES